MPDEGPLGETLFDERLLAMVAALRVNRPFGGCVESVMTAATHRREADFALPTALPFRFEGVFVFIAFISMSKDVSSRC